MSHHKGPLPTEPHAGTAVRFAVVGTNWITAALVEAGRTVPGFALSAVYSRTEARAAAFAAEIGAPRTHTSLAALGADPEVDAVYLASPNSLHAQQAIELLQAGKHVLVEKPAAANARAARDMFAAARANDRLLMEAYVSPFQPNFQAIQAAIPGLGQLRRAVLCKDQYSSRYDRYKAGELPNAFNPLMASGSLADIGYYPVAAAVWLFGPPQAVQATGILLPSGVDGQGTVLLDYGDMEVVALHSKIAGSPAWSHIEGEAGTISFDDCSVPRTVQLRTPGGPSHDRTPGQSEHHMRYEVAHFVECVTSGATESPVRTPAQTIATLDVLDQARRQVGVHFPGD